MSWRRSRLDCPALPLFLCHCRGQRRAFTNEQQRVQRVSPHRAVGQGFSSRNKFLAHIRETDATVNVVRCYGWAVLGALVAAGFAVRLALRQDSFRGKI